MNNICPICTKEKSKRAQSCRECNSKKRRASRIREDGKIICLACKGYFDRAFFNLKDSKSGRIQNVCKTCQNAAGNIHYKRNQAKYIDRAKLYSNNRKFLIYKNILAYFKTHFCVDCGEKDPLVLEFDHQGNKEYNISSMAKNNCTWELVEKEIAKCDVRCSNCHRRRHKIESNYAIYQLLQLENSQ